MDLGAPIESFRLTHAYGYWRMSMDSYAINMIIIKYKFSISRLHDLLNMMVSSHIFSKINFYSGYC